MRPLSGQALTFKRLKELCNLPNTRLNADKACEELGGLSRWWLKPETLELARGLGATLADRKEPVPPDLARDPGNCWVVFTAPGIDWPLLRPAVVLPLCWREEPSHSRLFPDKLRRLADLVYDQVWEMKQFKELFSRRWTLHPANGLGLKKSLADDLFGEVASGWASLAGGLLAAGQKQDPKASAWASVAWTQPGLTRVAGLPEKLAMAAAWAKAHRSKVTFYVHWAQADQAKEWGTPEDREWLEVSPVGVPRHRTQPWEVLETFVADLTDEPAPPILDPEKGRDQFDRCKYHYLNLRAFTDRAKKYYRSHLLEWIICRYRQVLLKQYGDLGISHCVTIVSESPELAYLAASALKAKSCLLLRTEDNAEKARDCASKLGERGCRCEFGEIGKEDPVGDIGKAVATFTDNVEPKQVVLDLKPGTTKMSYAIIRAARPGHRLLNLEPQFLDDRRNVPGTEEPELLEPISCHPLAKLA